MDGQREDACAEARRQVARLAAGIALGEDGFGLARHVRACAGCEDFVDLLARVRAWLVAGVRAPYARDPAAVDRRLRAALTRQLCARLARDLLALAQRGRARPVAARAGDWRRLVEVRGEAALAEPPFPLVRSVLLEELPPLSHAEMLGLASTLDPLGFDVALAHVSALERRGRGARAHAEVDRLLGLVVGEPEAE